VPTRRELAAYLGITEEEVVEGLVAAQAYTSASLNQLVRGQDSGEDSCERQELLGGLDTALELVPDLLALRDLLSQLPDRHRRLLALRFQGNLSQSQIAARMGVSQMQVSRLLAQVLGRLRQQLVDAQPRGGTRAAANAVSITAERQPDGALLMRIGGPVQDQDVNHLRDQLVNAAVNRRPTALVVDLAEVPAMVTSALRALLAAHRACGHVGARLLLTNVGAAVAVLLRRAGLARLVAGHTTGHTAGDPAGQPDPGAAEGSGAVPVAARRQWSWRPGAERSGRGQRARNVPAWRVAVPVGGAPPHRPQPDDGRLPGTRRFAATTHRPARECRLRWTVVAAPAAPTRPPPGRTLPVPTTV
jgi:anti-anti-sigma factor